MCKCNTEDCDNEGLESLFGYCEYCYENEVDVDMYDEDDEY